MTIINPEALEKVTAGDKELLADVAVLFVRLLPELEARMKFGIENGELNEVATSAHQLRSRAGYFGATELQNLSGQLESLALKNESESLSEIRDLHEQIFSGIDQMLEELRTLTDLSLIVVDE